MLGWNRAPSLHSRYPRETVWWDVPPAWASREEMFPVLTLPFLLAQSMSTIWNSIYRLPLLFLISSHLSLSLARSFFFFFEFQKQFS